MLASLRAKACRTGVIISRFSDERRQPRSKRGAWESSACPQASEQALRAGHPRPLLWLVTQFSKGIQRSKIDMKWNEEVIACVANVFLRFRSKEQGKGFSFLTVRKMNWEEKTALSFHFSPGQNRNSRSSSFLGHFSLLRNHTETLAAQAKEIRATSLQASSVGAGAQEFPRKLAQRSVRIIVVVSPGSKSIRSMTNRTIQHGLSEMFFN